MPVAWRRRPGSAPGTAATVAWSRREEERAATEGHARTRRGAGLCHLDTHARACAHGPAFRRPSVASALTRARDRHIGPREGVDRRNGLGFMV